MAKYDWETLRSKYLLGGYKSLRSFAGENGIPYNQHFRNATKGWADENKRKTSAKQAQIVATVTKNEIKREINRNATHMAVGDRIMSKLLEAVEAFNDDKNAVYKLKVAADALSSVQKIHRIGEDATKIDEREDDALSMALKEIAGDIDAD